MITHRCGEHAAFDIAALRDQIVWGVGMADGFDILREDYRINPDGSQHWTILEVKLYEGSIVTFPAYEKTEAVARSLRMAQSFEFWQKKMKERMHTWHSNSSCCEKD